MGMCGCKEGRKREIKRKLEQHNFLGKKRLFSSPSAYV